VANKAWYLVPLVGTAVAGFALGYYHQRPALNAAHRVLYYVDPMHPSYRSDKPGKAPDCGMDLVAVYADGVGQSLVGSEDNSSNGLTIDSAARKIYGIQLASVTNGAGTRTIHAFGKVSADDTRVYKVTVGADGYVKTTQDDAVGNHVKKDQHLAVIYSPEFLAVEGGFLSANERTPGATKDNVAANQNAASAQARADRLRNLGMSDAQIDEMIANHKIPEDVYVVSPTDGFILSRAITPGLRFERQKEFYTIADLSQVWVHAQVFGKDADKFRPGTVARVTLPDTGETFQARVSDVLPEVDPTTRALKVRLVVNNPGFKLRPDMFVNVDMPISLTAGLSVPADAIVDSGLAKQVFVQKSTGHFERREVETGLRFDDRVQIVKGLREGEIVVASGTFLVDSESRLQAEAGPGATSATPPPADSALAHRMN
jgi:membrane fusion protein, copper/silver efflux system